MIGVLALQGDFEAHGRMASALGHAVREVKAPEHLDGLDALVLPGGESTTMLKLLQAEAMTSSLVEFGRSGRPLLGTCAGAILLARRVTHPGQASLDLLDIDVERNAYGRQLDSFIASITEMTETSEEGLEKMIRDWAEANGFEKIGPIVHPTRLAVTGKKIGPGLWQLMAALGKDRLIQRLTRAKGILA